MVEHMQKIGRLLLALGPVLLCANCAVFAPVQTPPEPIGAAPRQTLQIQAGQIGYATRTAAPPPGFFEVAEYRTREHCEAIGGHGVRMVHVGNAAGEATTLSDATHLHFECTD